VADRWTRRRAPRRGGTGRSERCASSRRPRPLPAGPLYGLGVYAISLVGVGPALGLTGGPWGERTPTAFRRVLLHLVYGTVTAVVDERLRGRAG
jgi:hypothetical protein